MQHKSLSELRKAANLNQDELADRMHMSRSQYQRMEAGNTVLKVPQLYLLATALNVSMSHILNLPDAEASQAALNFLRHSIESQVISRLGRAELDYQEPVPFDELGEPEREWLRLGHIETQQQYEEAPPLVTRTNPAAATAIFAHLVQDMDVNAWFTHGIIQDEYLLRRWREHQANYAPYFTYEPGSFGRVMARTHAISPPMDEAEFEEDSQDTMQLLQQESDARHVAWCLDQVVYHGAGDEELAAALRHDPAAYNSTLTRLIGLIWMFPRIGADNIVGMDQDDIDAFQAQLASHWQPD